MSDDCGPFTVTQLTLNDLVTQDSFDQLEFQASGNGDLSLAGDHTLKFQISSDNYSTHIDPVTVSALVRVECDSLEFSSITPATWTPVAITETWTHSLSYVSCVEPTTDAMTLEFVDADS